LFAIIPILCIEHSTEKVSFIRAGRNLDNPYASRMIRNRKKGKENLAGEKGPSRKLYFLTSATERKRNNESQDVQFPGFSNFR